VTTGPEPGTGTLIEESTDYRLDEGDHERFSHYVPKDKLMQAMVEGIPVRALCGKLADEHGAGEHGRDPTDDKGGHPAPEPS